MVLRRPSELAALIRHVDHLRERLNDDGRATQVKAREEAFPTTRDAGPYCSEDGLRALKEKR